VYVSHAACKLISICCSALTWQQQAYTPRRLMALWHTGTAAQALGWLRLRAAGSALLFGRTLDAGVELPVSRCEQLTREREGRCCS